MAPIHRVAVAQWSLKDLAVEENHATACSYIRSAAAQGAELVVLPEYHLNGWAPKDPLYALQATQTGSYLSAYQALAKELKICLVPGTIVEKCTVNSELDDRGPEDGPNALFYNIAYFISNDGRILGQYRKKNIWHSEREFLTSSGTEPHDVFETPVGKVGMLICWDLAFPEAFRELIANGAEIIIIPTFWGRYDASDEALASNKSCEELFLESTLTARCFENTCGIIFANYSGRETSMGMSRVMLPIVGSVGKMGNEEGVLVVDMDLGLLRVAEENYKVRQDLAREGWHYTYRHSNQDRS